MIQEFVDIFMQNKDKLREQFAEKHPSGYESIVRSVVQLVADNDDYDVPDPDRITVINDGSYQGTIVFVIGEKGYQPSTYWIYKAYYGSCSYCDTFQRIRYSESYFDDEKPNESQVSDYMTMALHVVQGLKEV